MGELPAVDNPWGFAGVLAFVLGAIGIALIKQGRRSDKDAADDGDRFAEWYKKSSDERIARLEQNVDALTLGRSNDQVRISQLENALHDVQLVIAGPVTDLVTWIDQGAHPPPPTISAALRRVIQQAQD